MHEQDDFLPLKKVAVNKIEFNRKGKFKILLPKVFGFCGGVIIALKKMESALNRCSKNQKIFLLGEIIHNSTINDYLLDRKVNIIHVDHLKNVMDKADQNDIIIIPAFGIPYDLEIKIREKYNNVVNTACRYVKLVWDFIGRESKKDFTIIIYGQPRHQEVQAGISRVSKTGSVLVIPNLDTLEKFRNIIMERFKNKNPIDSSIFEKINEISTFNLSLFNVKKLALASQTTMLYNEVIIAEKILSDLSNDINSTFISCNTICRATYDRQNAAANLLDNNIDVVFVVGGYDSSNTNHLFELTNKKGCSFYIKDSTYITDSYIKHYIPKTGREISTSTQDVINGISTVAVLAGASCPFYIVKDVIDKLVSL